MPRVRPRVTNFKTLDRFATTRVMMVFLTPWIALPSRAAAAIGFCLMIAVEASAAHPSPYDTGQLRLSSFAAGLTANQKVSGTKVEFTSNGTSTLAPAGSNPANPSVAWGVVEVLGREVKIGGNSLSMPALPVPPDDQWVNAIRFASTHFAHSTTQGLYVKTYWYLEGLDGQNVVYEFPEVESTLDVSIYNKMVGWNTTQPIGDPPRYITLQSALTAGTAKSTICSTNDPRHELASGTMTYHTMTKAEIIGSLNTTTFIHTHSHGTSSKVESTGGESIYWVEIKNAVESGRTVPLPNIVVSYCCQTLATPYSSANAFHVMLNGNVLANRAIAGFDTDVWNGPIVNNEMSRTDEHAAELYKALADGKTIEQACNIADDLEPLLEDEDSGDSAIMMVNGDTYATIVGVYTNSQLQGSRPWYAVRANPTPGLWVTETESDHQKAVRREAFLLYRISFEDADRPECIYSVDIDAVTGRPAYLWLDVSRFP